MTRKCQVRFGGGRLEKDGNVPRQPPTLRALIHAIEYHLPNRSGLDEGLGDTQPT